MSDRKKLPAWAPPVAFVVALALFLFLSRQTPTLPGGGEAILSDSQYEAARIEMEKLSLNHIKAFDAGVRLSPAEMAEMRKASDIIDRMTRYAPLASGLFFLSGKIHHILGEDGLAEDRFLQCTLVVPNDANGHPDKAALIAADGAECNYQLSELLMLRREKEKALQAADAAVKVAPENPIYLTARASALSEMGQVEKAKADLQKALKIDPNNSRAKGLLRFLSRAAEDAATPKQP